MFVNVGLNIWLTCRNVHSINSPILASIQGPGATKQWWNGMISTDTSGCLKYVKYVMIVKKSLLHVFSVWWNANDIYGYFRLF